MIFGPVENATMGSEAKAVKPIDTNTSQTK